MRILSILSMVGYGVGSETYDSVFDDTARERWTSGALSLVDSCPLTADCTGVPGGDASGSGSGASSSSLVGKMENFHHDEFWKTNTRWHAD
mmetsp:Transcript_23793/g.53343  ORF Transcript_23793/g.53343 Transcript_23793/m.53343 type:complete len:91 (-) Transcript_23793:134-406(-)|eukprot:764982-Hanusia_phi.AAC.3